ncbi:MAG: TonB-dependent receptor [Myxococcales bacterium]|nr:TonB-dependent receptor [Myxococcales bacterium]MCB9550473.1 TonB-dependent receptor [Myxococcales bacterium]
MQAPASAARRITARLLALACVWPLAALGVEPLPAADAGPEAAGPEAAAAPAEEPEVMEVYGRRIQSAIDDSRPVDTVDRDDLDRRQPVSTPDALVLSPGVYVQQTAHGQASPYIRGRTGQQVLILFDGLRLNHALFRKGPNQYLFTVDAASIEQIEVVRGSASVELGADALGGAVLLHPIEPKIDPTRDALILRPRIFAGHRTADDERSGRVELDAQIGDGFGVLLGVGARTVGRLEAGGDAFPDGRGENQACVDNLTIPCFEPDGRTQLGTGFDELTADARATALIPDGRVALAAYLYRQYDAPRTDQCPPPEQATGECLTFDEQFRTHVYGEVEHAPGAALLDAFTAALGYQRQHQRYTLLRPDRIVGDSIDTTTENLGRDAVDGLGFTFRGAVTPLALGDFEAGMRYGVDGSHEWVESAKWIRFAQPPLTRKFSRGQYVGGADYTQGGVWIAPDLRWRFVRVRGGVRAAYVGATSPGDEESASRAFDRSYAPLVFGGGLDIGGDFGLVLNVEQGFRAPNLDDLTARQSTGQGYQLENPDLGPETSLTLEAGLRARHRALTGELLAYRQTIDDAIERRLLDRDDCSLSEDVVDRECRANRAPIKLVNLTGTAEIIGFDARLEYRPIRPLELRATVAYAHGEGDNPGAGDPRRIPLSRIAPLNGTGLVEWADPDSGLFIGGVVRWATEQDRLSPGDVADARIPRGGTPGYVTVDAWAGIRVDRQLFVGVKLVNLNDERYRIHGSSIYGAGRSVSVSLSLSPVPGGELAL